LDSWLCKLAGKRASACHRSDANPLARRLLTRNAIDRAVVSCLGDAILPEHLPPALLKAVESRRAAAQAQVQAAPSAAPAASAVAPGGSGTLQSEIDAFEKARIIDTLERCGGNQSRAARLLGISRGTLIARLDAFAIARPRKGERSAED